MACRNRDDTESFYSGLGVNLLEFYDAEIGLFFVSQKEAISDSPIILMIQCDDLNSAIGFVEESGQKLSFHLRLLLGGQP
jgi:hypothetical protein